MFSIIWCGRVSAGVPAERHDRAMGGTAFHAYVEQILGPALKHRDIVVMDNLTARNPTAVRASIEVTGAELRVLPRYSPDFNSN